MEIARLIVSFKLNDSGQVATIGVDVENYSALTAKEVVVAISRSVNEQYMAPVWHKAEITNIVELTPRIRPRVANQYYSECIVCGQPNGHGGLACPKTKVTS